MPIEDDDVAGRQPRPWLWALLVLLVAFAGGAGAACYVVAHDTRAARMLGLAPAADLAAAQAQAVTARQALAHAAPVAPPPAPAAAQDSELAARIDTLQSKVDDIEGQARAATGDASRAEGLLVAFAARRALDRGIQLGYIEGLLRQRFATTQRQAVATILSASRVPVTLPDLETGLDAVAPTLAAGGEPRTSWWQSFRQELATLVVVRRTGDPSTQPADRVARAQRMLEAGQVDGALAEIVRLPDHAAADRWIMGARRYLAGRGALDEIETAALLDPATVAVPLPPAPAPAPASAVGPAESR